MNCRKMKLLLVAFLENELSGRRKEKVEAHLKVCTNCQKEKELLSKSWQMLDNYAAPKLKDDFTSSLMRKIRSEQEEETEIVRVTYKLPRFSFEFGLRRLAPALALFLVVILIVALLWKKPMDKQQLAKLPSPEPREIPEAPVEIVPVVPQPQEVVKSPFETAISVPEMSAEEPVKITTPAPRKVAVKITDEEIIRNLDLYEYSELLENLDLLEELDVVENLDTLT